MYLVYPHLPIIGGWDQFPQYLIYIGLSKLQFSRSCDTIQIRYCCMLIFKQLTFYAGRIEINALLLKHSFIHVPKTIKRFICLYLFIFELLIFYISRQNFWQPSIISTMSYRQFYKCLKLTNNNSIRFNSIFLQTQSRSLSFVNIKYI